MWGWTETVSEEEGLGPTGWGGSPVRGRTVPIRAADPAALSLELCQLGQVVEPL